MSFPEILDAIETLTQNEKRQLIHRLVDDLTHPEPAQDDIPAHLQHLIPPPGTVFDVWFPDANPGAVAAALQALQSGDGV